MFLALFLNMSRNLRTSIKSQYLEPFGGPRRNTNPLLKPFSLSFSKKKMKDKTINFFDGFMHSNSLGKSLLSKKSPRARIFLPIDI